MGAAGRDFHVFNCCYRDRNDVEVVAFTAAQIPHIEDRRYPAVLAGKQYPNGIPIHPEEELDHLIKNNHIDEVVSEGDRSFVRLRYTGTHQGEILEVAPTGRRIEYAGAALFQFRGNLIASVWVLGDIYGLLRQIGGAAAR